MAETRTVWIVKTMAIVLATAVLVSLATTLLQLWITGKSNGAVSGGVSTAIVIVILHHRRKSLPVEPERQPKT